ncbi:MAG: hypothetical protein C0602_05875 [Denitrovibrio sp.]|nr:MAG: hypothetical protein C0602_05875 [Denitrovibrio sp.]
MSDVPTNAVFTDNPVELNGFVQNLAEEDFHMAKDYIWMLQRFYCYQTIRDMIPAYIMNRVRDMHELKWEMVQLLNSSSSVI